LIEVSTDKVNLKEMVISVPMSQSER